MTIILEILSKILEESQEIEEKDFSSFLTLLFSLILFKKNCKSAFLYSLCLGSLSMKDLSQNNFSEFGFSCQTCKEKFKLARNICLVCVHRCHVGHKVIPNGYAFFDCKCSVGSFVCNATKCLEIPFHIKNYNFTPLTMIYPENDELKNICKVKLINLNIILFRILRVMFLLH